MSRPTAPTTWEAYVRALGAELQQRRTERGLTQEVLAHLAGMTRSHYQQLERGLWKLDSPANPSLKMLVRLAQVLELEPGELLPSVTALNWSDGRTR